MDNETIAVIVVCEIFLFFLGASIMSFLEVLIERVPKGVSPFGGRSKCDSCGHTLGVFELIPVFSWLFLGGKCKHCKAKIPYIYPLKELCGGLMLAYFAFSYGIKYGITVKTFAYAFIAFIFVCVLNVAGCIYLKTEKIGYCSVIAMLAPVIGQIVIKIIERKSDEIAISALAGVVTLVYFVVFALIGKSLHLSDALFGLLAGMVLTLTQTLIGLAVSLIITMVCVIQKRYFRDVKFKKIHYLSHICLGLAIASMTMMIYRW